LTKRVKFYCDARAFDAIGPSGNEDRLSRSIDLASCITRLNRDYQGLISIITQGLLL